MKKIMKSAIAVALFVSALTAAILASPNTNFAVTNNTTFDLGVVTIYNNDGTPTTVQVSGSGTYPVSIQGGVVAVVINGQSVPKNGQWTKITLASGIVVQATLTGSQIVVQDESIIQGDKKPHSK